MSLSFSGVCAGVASVFVDTIHAIAPEYWDIVIIIIDNFSIVSGVQKLTELYIPPFSKLNEKESKVACSRQ